MAASPCAATAASFLPPPTNPFPQPLEPVILLSSISSPFPSKPTRRKNHLRKKLLKSLTNHVIPKTQPENPVIPFEYPQEQQPEAKNLEETHELQGLTSEATAGIFGGEFGKFATTLVPRLGLCLVGAFVFHKIYAVWVSGSVKSSQEDGNLDSVRKTRVSELGIDASDEVTSGGLLNGSGNSFRGKLGSKQGGNGFVGGSEFEKKISEIQAMARAVREKERLGSKVNASDNTDVKAGTETEVDSYLVKVPKRLQNRNEKPLFPISYYRKDGQVEGIYDEDGVDMKDEKQPLMPLMLEEEYKHRSPRGNVRDVSKGFNGSDDRSIRRNTSTSSVVEDGSIRNGSVDSDSVDLLAKVHELDHPNGDFGGSVCLPLEEDSGRKPAEEKSIPDQNTRKKLGNAKEKGNFGKGNGVGTPERGNGATQADGLGRPLVKGLSSRKTTIGSQQAGGRFEDRHSDNKADLWWLSLPHVLVILCHDVEGSKGIYILKSQDNSSHAVAFENQGDATNFCYLLQSFSEDLGDFSAEIVPLSVKDLNEAASSDNLKLIVVKKGQLKLYAGQSREEVEMALRSLVK